jgi:hypothetical protein
MPAPLRVEPHHEFASRAALALGASLIGCADTTRPSAQTHVVFRSVETPGTEHYQETEDETATATVALASPAPEYPAQMVGLHLAHVAVNAKLIVDTDQPLDECQRRSG